MRKAFVFIAVALLGAGLLSPPVIEAGPPDGVAAEAAPEGIGSFDLNSVSFDELVTIPGIGPSLAERILDYRARHDGFARVEELLDIRGIGTKSFEKIRNRFTLPASPPRVATTPLPSP